ncbi:hypothetical protein [Streptomyces sp. NPDC058157]|uniref:hypothetical protein n=1 Tax=Streptomyces sp. NPDC058157 TaxID=3346360 RepID=UPI0036EABEF3
MTVTTLTPMLTHWIENDPKAQHIRDQLAAYAVQVGKATFLHRDVLRQLQGHVVALRVHERRGVYKPGIGRTYMGVRLDLLDLDGGDDYRDVWVTAGSYRRSLPILGTSDWVLRQLRQGDAFGRLPKNDQAAYLGKLAIRLFEAESPVPSWGSVAA